MGLEETFAQVLLYSSFAPTVDIEHLQKQSALRNRAVRHFAGFAFKPYF